MTGDRQVLTESVHIPVGGEAPMGGYLARPVSADPLPAVLVGMELFGVSAHVRDVCDRLASLGFLALAPDLYHRSAPGIELPADDRGRTCGLGLLGQLTRQAALDDIGSASEYLHSRSSYLAGMVGLSVGGHLAYLAAAHFTLPAVAVVYGGWIPTTDIPLSQPEATLSATPDITGKVLFLVARELARVAAAGARVVLAAWVPSSVMPAMGQVLGPYLPPPPPSSGPPSRWGDPDALAELLGPSGLKLTEVSKRRVTLQFPDAAAGVGFLIRTAGHVIREQERLTAEGRWENLRHDLTRFVDERGERSDGRLNLQLDYLLASATRAGEDQSTIAHR